MTNEEAIKFLSQIKDALLANNSWLPSTDDPIKESFGMAINALTAQPEKRTEERTETHACDCISRQDAIGAVKEERFPIDSDYAEGFMAALDKVEWILKEWLPYAQPEIVQCEDCQHWEQETFNDGYCTEMDLRMCDADFYCGYAERRTDDR